MPGEPPDNHDDEDDELATRPHRKVELPAAGELFDTVDDEHDFENQVTPLPKFLQEPAPPKDDDETRPVPLLDDEDGELG